MILESLAQTVTGLMKKRQQKSNQEQQTALCTRRCSTFSCGIMQSKGMCMVTLIYKFSIIKGKCCFPLLASQAQDHFKGEQSIFPQIGAPTKYYLHFADGGEVTVGLSWTQSRHSLPGRREMRGWGMLPTPMGPPSPIGCAGTCS